MSLVGSKNCTDTKSEPYSSSDELIETWETKLCYTLMLKSLSERHGDESWSLVKQKWRIPTWPTFYGAEYLCKSSHFVCSFVRLFWTFCVKFLFILSWALYTLLVMLLERTAKCQRSITFIMCACQWGCILSVLVGVLLSTESLPVRLQSSASQTLHKLMDLLDL